MVKSHSGRTAIYMSNVIVPGIASLIRLAGFKGAWGVNVGGALFYGGLDLLGAISPRIKDSRFNRLTKLVGTLAYATKTVVDIGTLAINKDYSSIVDLAMDIPMTFQLGKDTYDLYNGKDLVTDLGF